MTSTVCNIGYLLFHKVSWNVAKRICVSEGVKAAGIPARLAEVNSQHKNDQLNAHAASGTKKLPNILIHLSIIQNMLFHT